MVEESGKAKKELSGRRSNRTPATRTLWDQFVFYLPLALTHVMVAGGTPIVNAGIARRPDPVEGLAAFAVAFSVMVFFNSMCFVIEPAVVELIRGRASFRRMTGFALGMGAFLVAVIAILGLSPLSGMMFEGLFDLSPSISLEAARTLLVFCPLPFLLSMRSIGRGALTRLSRTSLVGWGTLLRLIAMIFVVVAGVLGLPLPGPVLGALAFVFGILIEALFVMSGALRHIPDLPGDEEGGVGTSYRAIWRFISPLLVSGLVGVSTFIVTNAILSRTPDAELAVSSFSVVRSVAWFFSSMLLAYHQLVIARATNPAEEVAVRRFATIFALCLTINLAIISYTPLGHLIFRHLIGVSGETLRAATETLVLAPLIPAVLGYRSYLRGAAIRDHHSGAVLASSVSALLVATLTGLVLKDVLAVGAMVAVVMWIMANIGEAAMLKILSWRALLQTPSGMEEKW